MKWTTTSLTTDFLTSIDRYRPQDKARTTTMQTVIPALNDALLPLYGPRETRAITEFLIQEVCGWTRTEYVLRRHEVLQPDQRQQLLGAARRLAAGEPVQYVLGYAWFCGLRIGVTPDVLIPRPETEELVRWIAGEAASTPAPRILDVGTGSGCIAIALARLLPDASLVAADISTAALEVAKRNAQALGAGAIDFRTMDILHEDAPAETAAPPYDIIVSNPPYVRLSEAARMPPNVLQHEPGIALFVPDDDPLRYYRAIARHAHAHLRKGGDIYLEINASLADQTESLLRDEGFINIVIHKDIHQRDRMIKCTK